MWANCGVAGVATAAIAPDRRDDEEDHVGDERRHDEEEERPQKPANDEAGHRSPGRPVREGLCCEEPSLRSYASIAVTWARLVCSPAGTS